MRPARAAPALVAVALAALAGCKFEPAGRCETAADCAAGLDCLRGICAHCTADLDCAAWEACGAAGQCAARPGRCDGDLDCEAWDRCDADHACVHRAGYCPWDASVTCAAWEECGAAHLCTPMTGRCNASADCLPWADCDTAGHACVYPTTSGADVIALGALVEGAADRGAVSRIVSPSRLAVGFDPGAIAGGRAAIDPSSGALVYRHAGDAGGDTLRRFGRDALAWDRRSLAWTYPADPLANDPVAVDTSACPKTWDRFVMQGGTGAILYGCPGGAVWSWFDSAGALQLSSIEALSWNARDYVLARTAVGGLVVLAPSTRAATAVANLPAGAALLVARTTATGFRAAIRLAGGGDELWSIDDATASATRVGPYAPFSGAYGDPAWEVMDADGALYARAWVSLYDVVLKRPIQPGTTAEAYTEANAPAGADAFGATTFKAWLKLDPGSFLATTP